MAKDFAEYVCSSSTDLSTGQAITVGSNSTKITSVTYPPGASTPFVRVANTPTYNITEPLSFTAPVLGPEIQFPTKSAAAPATLAWSQGDMEQNAAATANGVAAWVNVAGGTPGTWAGIPLGDSKGKIDASQLSSARSAQAFCAGTASSSTSLLLFGAGTAQTTCTQSPGPQTLQQILLTTAGSLSNLAVRCGHQGSQPSSGSFSVWDLPSGVPMTNASSGTNTGLTVTIGNSPANANKTLFDTLRRFDYAAGDMIRIQFTTQANETLADCTASVNY
jgi:membrane-associated protease RseP (regulator of RpoE activity)